MGSAGAKRRALDVGCSVGRSTFRLAELFDEAVGIDFSQAFVDAANRLKDSREHPFTYLVEGELEASAVARIGAGLDTSKVHFQRGDACHLDVAALGRFHVIHGANLLCRLPDPQLFLDTLPSLLVDRGLVLFISPYSWLPSYTEKKHWIGGFADAEGKPVWSREGLIERMSKNFEVRSRDPGRRRRGRTAVRTFPPSLTPPIRFPPFPRSLSLYFLRPLESSAAWRGSSSPRTTFRS